METDQGKVLMRASMRRPADALVFLLVLFFMADSSFLRLLCSGCL
jgi:hypothetical protein